MSTAQVRYTTQTSSTAAWIAGESHQRSVRSVLASIRALPGAPTPVRVMFSSSRDDHAVVASQDGHPTSRRPASAPGRTVYLGPQQPRVYHPMYAGLTAGSAVLPGQHRGRRGT